MSLWWWHLFSLTSSPCLPSVGCDEPCYVVLTKDPGTGTGPGPILAKFILAHPFFF